MRESSNGNAVERLERGLERLRRLAWLLDSSIPIPGTRYRIGLDPLIGLIPGLGDLVGLGLSTWIVFQASRLGAGRATLGRMVWNILIETAIGAIPLLGDVFDAGWKANARNMALLERSVKVPGRRKDTLFAVLLGAGLVLAMAALGWGVVAVAGWVARLF